MTTLLLIDCQKDFHPGGSLAVPNADQDAERITQFIHQNATSIHRIVATMDSHHPLHIAHPSFWSDGQGNLPEPFTVISMEDVVEGRWIPREDVKPSARESLLIEDDILGGGIPSELYSTDETGNRQLNMKQWCIEYTRRLEAKGKFSLMIWPEHCLVGTEGQTVVRSICDAMMEWSRKTGGSVEWVNKGQNLLTENYSALCAEVPVTKGTSFNYELLESVSILYTIFVCVKTAVYLLLVTSISFIRLLMHIFYMNIYTHIRY
jgi:nicotinamidase-related amidase